MPVIGTVTYAGDPVRGGTLTFRPRGSGEDAGRPGTGKIDDDGVFEVSTYRPGDGAIVGEHEVSYAPPSPGDDAGGGEHGGHRPSEYAGLVPKQREVTIGEGTNVVDVELVAP